MAKNLGFGSQLIRTLLVAGILVSLAGVFLVQIPSAGLRVLFSISALIYLAVFLMLAARKLATRVKCLAGIMDQAAEGNLSVRGEDLSLDEVGMLNSNFNEMLERLGSVVVSIRSAVSELRVIGGNVGTVAAQGLALAEGQKDTADRAKAAARQIRQSVEEVASSVEGLSGAAGTNAASIQQMVSSTVQINQLVEQLLRSVELVSDSIARMAGGQNEINSNVHHLMENATRTTVLVADMERSVRQIEQSAQTTARISVDVLRDAELGNTSVESTISGIYQIRSASHTVEQAVGNLSVYAARIGTILQVIDEVTEQTKLLALNASIIAAQAGEHGKGFGVVAHEIKELARRTTASTRQIAEIVNGVKGETEKAVMAITLSEQAVAEGEQLSQRSGAALHKIVRGVKVATEQVSEIARATEHHAQQGEKMRLAMEEMGAMVEQIVRSSVHQTRDAEVINQASDSMRQLANNVHVNARSHNDAGAAIADSTGIIVKMIEEIRHACVVQSEGSEQVVHTAEEMEEAVTGNLKTTRVMEEAVSGLSRQIKSLEQEMAGFKLEK
jgi:methyl-accepting chemotaxis protein